MLYINNISLNIYSNKHFSWRKLCTEGTWPSSRLLEVFLTWADRKSVSAGFEFTVTKPSCCGGINSYAPKKRHIAATLKRQFLQTIELLIKLWNFNKSDNRLWYSDRQINFTTSRYLLHWRLIKTDDCLLIKYQKLVLHSTLTLTGICGTIWQTALLDISWEYTQ